MIPQFPKFKNLELSDDAFVRSCTASFPPYSDFNFVSMWSWNTNNGILLSQLHGNLVVRFIDYISAEPFYSFIGIHKVNETAKELLEFSIANNAGAELKLVPEVVIHKLDREKFKAEDDPAHTDYVLTTDKLATYEGAELAGKRRSVSIFTRRTPHFRFEILDLENTRVTKEIRNLFDLWLLQKNIQVVEDEEHEYVALSRCLTAGFNGNLVATGVYVGDMLSAFWIVEDLQNTYSVSHFEKAYTAMHSSIFPFLKQKTGEVLHARNIKYVNLEQDLGLIGLRRSKISYFPQLFLKKYRVGTA